MCAINEFDYVPGVDVYWSGHVNAANSNPLDDQCPLAAPSTSQTHFGFLKVCPFPFTAELQFDDVPECTTFSLASSIYEDTFELFIADLQQLVDDNRSEQIVNFRQSRRAIRCLSNAQAYIEVEMGKILGKGILRGKIMVKSQADNEPDSLISPGFQVYLMGTTLVRTKGFTCSCLYPTGDILMDRIVSSKSTQPLDLNSPVIHSIANAIPDHRLSAFLSKLSEYHQHREKDATRKNRCLDNAFYAEVFTNCSVDFVQLCRLLKDKYTNICDQIFADKVDVELIETRIVTTFLDRCTKPELYWFRFWMDYSKHHLDMVPSSVSINPKDFSSILYQHWTIKKLEDLVNLGFQQYVLSVSPFQEFWVELSSLRSSIYYKSPNHLKESMSAVRMEIVRCGYSPDQASSICSMPKSLSKSSSSNTSINVNAVDVAAKKTETIGDEDNDSEIDVDLLDDIATGIQSGYGLKDDRFIEENTMKGSEEEDDEQEDEGIAAYNRSKRRPSNPIRRENNSDESDADEQHMKFTLGKVKSAVDVVTRMRSSTMKDSSTDINPSQNHLQNEALTTVFEEGKVKSEFIDEDDDKLDVSIDSQDSTSSDSLYENEIEDIITPAQINIPYKNSEGNSQGLLRVPYRRISTKSMTISGSPIARVHHLELRRQQRRSFLDRVWGSLPECGPGRRK
uniref:Uncharacterized protein n=1 Tax=Spongospora subterranea TaxID=70186 RepID=A0A0H5RCX7_9EUKA|eukprot:CRZ11828.1 hypothetical protein [Spongospora subterranea]